MSKLTLSMDTAVSLGSFSIWEDNEKLIETVGDSEIQPSENVLSVIGNLLNSVNGRPDDLDRIVCTSGPGSYTGMRVGISTALGISRAIGCELISVSVFEAFNRSLEGQSVRIPFLFSGKKELMFQVFRSLKKAKYDVSKIRTTPIENIPNIVADFNDHKLISDSKSVDRLKQFCPSDLVSDNLINISNSVSELAFEVAAENGFVDERGDFEPIYGKDFGS